MAGGMCRKEARAASWHPSVHPHGVREEPGEWAWGGCAVRARRRGVSWEGVSWLVGKGEVCRGI